MISPLHQFTLTQLIIGAVFIVVLLAAVQHWALRRLNSEPGDDVDNASGDKASEILGDAPVRSKVGTPRPRRLQPLRAGEEEPALASSRSGAAAEVPADSLAMAGSTAPAKSKETKPTAPAAKPTILPPLVTALADATGTGTKKPEPVTASTDKPRESVVLPPLAVGAKAGDNLVSAPQPVSLASTTGAPQVAAPETDDVKKRKTPPGVSGTEQKSGVQVPGPKSGDVAAGAPPLTPAEPVKPTDTPTAPKPEAAPKTGDRPRIFLPANLPAASSKPANEPVPVPAFPAAPTPVEAKVSVPAVPAKPADADVKPIAEPVSTTPPEKKPEATTGPKTGVKPEPPAISVPPVPPIPAQPVAAKTEASKPAPPAAVPAKGEEKAPVPILPAVEVSKPADEVPASSVPPPVPILPREAAPKETVSTPLSIMAQNENTTDMPANSRASAQLTLGFEVTSLQLTPFFKLGAVQLKALSNVASLHLIATQSADNPLAAGISFQIDNVELNESSHIRSILLKPFQGAEPAAVVPQGKFQVDAIQLGQGDEGAPISVTSSGQNSTAVQMLATFSIASMEFTPSFEIGALRLEPTSNSVLLRLAPSSRPTALDLPPSFEVSSVQLGDNSQLATVKLTPGNK